MKAAHRLFVVDDDAGVRKSISWMLETNGYACAAFESAERFLDEVVVDRPSCLILDLQIGRSSGLDVLREMRTHSELSMPVIMLTGTATVADAVMSLKYGAEDVLEKPVHPDLLLQKVGKALEQHSARRSAEASRNEVSSRVNQLTNREREVLGLLCQGLSTKEMARMLNISQKTIAIHRGHLLKKMNAASSTDAVRLALRSVSIDQGHAQLMASSV